MNIFNRKTKKKHIEQFELNIAQVLKNEMPEIGRAMNRSKIFSINFGENPLHIYITRGYNNPKDYEIVKKLHTSNYYLTGISILNKNTKRYQPIVLFYQSDGLTRIEIDNPQYFHKNFNWNQIQKNQIKLKKIKIENPDKKIAEMALRSLSENQIKLLDLDYTFEIEFGENSFYTILDMEDGNYIAVDKKGKIYRLNHDHAERVKLISKSPTAFFKTYNGNKNSLQEIMYE